MSGGEQLCIMVLCGRCERRAREALTDTMWQTEFNEFPFVIKIHKQGHGIFKTISKQVVLSRQAASASSD